MRKSVSREFKYGFLDFSYIWRIPLKRVAVENDTKIIKIILERFALVRFL